MMLMALLGGAYSSTATTIALAKRSATDQRPHVYAGSILMASGVMYLRLALLVSLFNQDLRQMLLLPLGILGGVGIVVGAIWALQGYRNTRSVPQERVYAAQNPLELRAALAFALLFMLMVVITHYAVLYLGNTGVYALAAVMGVTDVDPFVLGMTQSAEQGTALTVAASAIAIAAASNNAGKGGYALIFCDRTTGIQAISLLLFLAVAGLIPLLWLL
jgi:uncharacterized membrane protein (DUF4010 family)